MIANKPGWVMAVLRYADGREEVLSFHDRFMAELFVSWIPAMAPASEEYADVRGAIIRETVEVTGPTVMVDRSN